MGFTQACFIRKNTPELRKKLEELGYIPPYKIWSDENFAICTIYRDNIGEYIVFKIDDDFENVIKPSYPYIDCGTNEELFLALTSLRDDTDKNQYWICDKVSVTIGKTYYPGNYIYYQYDEFFDKQNWHKATTKEIIEHFKDNSKKWKN